MSLEELLAALRHNGELVVFVNVFLQQLGLPVPAVPTMLMLGSQASAASLGLLVLFATCASVIADWIWYLVGRRYGYGVLGWLCRLSINPGSCVTQTEDRFMKWGAWSLVAAKFIPGFAIVAPPIAGAVRMPLASFLAAAAVGAALWAGVSLLGGLLFREQIEGLLRFLAARGLHALLVAALLVGGWIAFKLWQKRRHERLSKVPRLSVEKLVERLAHEPKPLVLDLRSELMRSGEPGVPGSVQASLETLAARVAEVPPDTMIVTMCACPEDAAAVIAAQRLQKMGYANAWPLEGGIEAWVEGRTPA